MLRALCRSRRCIRLVRPAGVCGAAQRQPTLALPGLERALCLGHFSGFLSQQQPLAVIGIEGESFQQLEQELREAGYRQAYSDETFYPIELELSQRTTNGLNNYVTLTIRAAPDSRALTLTEKLARMPRLR